MWYYLHLGVYKAANPAKMISRRSRIPAWNVAGNALASFRGAVRHAEFCCHSQYFGKELTAFYGFHNSLDHLPRSNFVYCIVNQCGIRRWFGGLRLRCASGAP